MTNQVAVVTGAARGIGLATTKLLTVKSPKVVMVDRDKDELNVARSLRHLKSGRYSAYAAASS